MLFSREKRLLCTFNTFWRISSMQRPWVNCYTLLHASTEWLCMLQCSLTENICECRLVYHTQVDPHWSPANIQYQSRYFRILLAYHCILYYGLLIHMHGPCPTPPPPLSLSFPSPSDPTLLPQLQVDKGAIKFVLSGANIMCPGLTSPGARMDVSVPGDTVIVSLSVWLVTKFGFRVSYCTLSYAHS